MSIRRGEVHGLVGQNGCGKSTLIKILAGYHHPDPGGELEIDGQPVKLPVRTGSASELGLSFVHQDLGLLPSLTVVENFRAWTISTKPEWLIRWSKERERTEEAFARFGLRLDPRAEGGRSARRAARAAGHRPRPRGPGRVHEGRRLARRTAGPRRADGVPAAHRQGPALRCRPQERRARGQRPVRVPRPGRGAGRDRPDDRSSRRQRGRHGGERRDREGPARRDDHRQASGGVRGVPPGARHRGRRARDRRRGPGRDDQGRVLHHGRGRGARPHRPGRQRVRGDPLSPVRSRARARRSHDDRRGTSTNSRACPRRTRSRWGWRSFPRTGRAPPGWVRCSCGTT